MVKTEGKVGEEDKSGSELLKIAVYSVWSEGAVEIAYSKRSGEFVGWIR